MSSQILLSLCASCAMQPLPRKGTLLDLLDIPKFVSDELELRGLNIPAELIRGRPAQQLERLRDEADRAHCPCLMLYQDSPLDFVNQAESATKSLQGLARAAMLMGCSELAVRLACAPAQAPAVSSSVKALLQTIQPQDMNLLIRPNIDPPDETELILDLVKRVGGFHIGAMPSFAHASVTPDAIETLRKLAPYSAAIEVTVAGFNKDGEHHQFDLFAYLEALVSYGYMNKLAINWVGKTNWVQGVTTARERLMAVLGREEQVP